MMVGLKFLRTGSLGQIQPEEAKKNPYEPVDLYNLHRPEMALKIPKFMTGSVIIGVFQEFRRLKISIAKAVIR
ncbi:MAG: hypothetical protein Ct9H300mP19_19300 [Dehalococcoidia bacterium]|nr:MAG: hypothetical protein Ct9H300mP19_19300 [Dehalococcoidia bacterium]